MQLDAVNMDGEEWQHAQIDYQWNGETHQYDLYWNEEKGRVYKDGELICVDFTPSPAGALCN